MREDRTAFEVDAPSDGTALGPPSDLTVDRATDRDVAGCVALAGLVADGTDEAWAALFRRDIGHADRFLAVARTGGDLVGYGRTAWFEPDEDAPPNAAPAGYYLVGLVVEPAWRRRGIARAITAARLTWVAGRATEAWYMADRANAVSIRLHEVLGFGTVTEDVWFPTTEGEGDHLLGRIALTHPPDPPEETA